MSSDLRILLTDNEPGLFIMQALAAMPHGPIARDTRERATREAPCNYYVQYDALSCASL